MSYVAVGNVHDSEFFDWSIASPTPRASEFPPILIPPPQQQLLHYDSLSPYTNSPFSTPSPQTDYSTTTSLSMSPSSPHSSLIDEFNSSPASLNFVGPMLSSPLSGIATTAPATKHHSKSADATRQAKPPPPRKGDPSYIPRPENAFILFRKDAVQKMRAKQAEAELRSVSSSPASSSSNGKSEKGKRQRQADMSKHISHLWKALSPEDRSEWETLAARIKREHEAKHPDYRYQPARPGTNGSSTKRAALSGSMKGKTRLIRKRGSTAGGSETNDEDSNFSEDLAVVVRPTRGPRRTSVCSVASSASSYASPSPSITLPTLEGLSRSASPYLYARTARGSRQWIQPPADDPSPPPSTLFFSRENARSGVELYHSSPMSLEPSPQIHSSRSSPIVTNPTPLEESGGNIFVEPITSDRNPWSPGGSSKMPSTPRRPSARSQRLRSLSLPHPLQLTQSRSSVQDEEPTFDLSLGWSPQTPIDMQPSQERQPSSDAMPWSPQSLPFDHSAFTHPSLTSSAKGDGNTEQEFEQAAFGSEFDGNGWFELMTTDPLNLPPFGMFDFPFSSQSTDISMDDNESPSRPFF